MYRRIKRAWVQLRTSPVLATLFDILLLAAVMFAIHAWQTRDLPVSEPAPARPLFTLDGETLKMPVEEGSVGVVYFFAPWCHVCRASMGNLEDLLEGGQVDWSSAIALDYENTAQVQQFVDQLGITMPVFLGAGPEIANWKIRGYPTYFVINSDYFTGTSLSPNLL